MPRPYSWRFPLCSQHGKQAHAASNAWVVMTTAHLNGGRPTDVDDVLDRLNDPAKLAALNTLVDNLELLAVLVAGLDGLARKGDLIADTAAEVLDTARAASRSTGLDVRRTSEQLATLIPTLAEAAPAINRVAHSAIVHEQAVEVVGLTAQAVSEGYQRVAGTDKRVARRHLLKIAKEPEVQRGLAFLVEVARVLGTELAQAPPHKQPQSTTEQ